FLRGVIDASSDVDHTVFLVSSVSAACAHFGVLFTHAGPVSSTAWCKLWPCALQRTLGIYPRRTGLLRRSNALQGFPQLLKNSGVFECGNVLGDFFALRDDAQQTPHDFARTGF